MSVDHSVIKSRGQDPVFLRVKSGDIVLVWDLPGLIDSGFNAWWMGEVIFVEGSARDPKAPSLFQIAYVDTGVVRWWNVDCVQKELRPLSKLWPDTTHSVSTKKPASWAGRVMGNCNLALIARHG